MPSRVKLDHAEAEWPVGRGDRFQEWFLSWYFSQRHPGQDIPLPKRGAFAAGIELVPRVNHGRWVVDCPFCPGAQIASAQDPRFFCSDCFHAGTDAEGKWLRVSWPTQRTIDAVEDALIERTRRENRNWRPADETTKDLRMENDAMRAVGGL